MRHFRQILLLTAVSSALLFFNGPADAHGKQVAVKKQASIVKVARSEQRGRDWSQARHDNGSRRNDSGNRRHNDRQRQPRQERDHHRQSHYDRPQRRHDSVRHYGGPGYWRDYDYGRHPEYRHRYYHGHHYYYNHAGFYFPGLGFIAHGHVHGPHCPHWHFEPFAAGILLGTILNN